MEKTLNPNVSPRMRGVVEKCNFCHGRLHAAREKAAAEGREQLRSGDYVPACVEACPTRAMVFGDLNDENSEVGRLARRKEAFRLLESLGTEPKIFYFSRQPWVNEASQKETQISRKEEAHG
jgi:Fe-S-cluster-containing dehydrogenase component